MAVTWIAAHDADNAGDIVLLDAMEKFIRQLFPTDDISKVADWKPANVDELNKSECIIVGGGGLFIRDTKPNNASGWRWNISADQLRQITAPIVVWSVGLNRFRGQEDYNHTFSEHLTILARKATFVGMREQNSIQRLRQYIGDLIEDIHWMPCAAAVCGLLYPQPPDRSSKKLIFAPAMDRLQHRGNIQNVTRTLRELDHDWDIHIACHITPDLDIRKYLSGVDCTVDDLHGKPAAYILDYYRKAGAVIGMRLHSLLIPFGYGIPVLPVISHDKIADWLLDIGHPEWGVELTNPNIGAEITGGKWRDNYDPTAVMSLYDVIMRNIEYINVRLS